MEEIYKAVTKQESEKLFRKYYHILTKDSNEHHYNNYLNYLIDRYTFHKNHKNQSTLPFKDKRYVGEVGALSDGIERLINEWNEVSKTPKEDRWKL